MKSLTIFIAMYFIPEVRLSPTPKILGTDGRKMSKSLNIILVFQINRNIKTKVLSMVTDPKNKIN